MFFLYSPIHKSVIRTTDLNHNNNSSIKSLHELNKEYRLVDMQKFGKQKRNATKKYIAFSLFFFYYFFWIT